MYSKSCSEVNGNVYCILYFNYDFMDFHLRDYPFYPSFPSYSFSEEQSTMEIVRLTAELATLGERVTLTTGLEPIVLLHRDPIRMNWH